MEGKERQVLVDTGADVSVFPEHWIQKAISEGQQQIQGIGGTQIATKWSNIRMVIGKKFLLGTGVTLPEVPVPLLGRDNLKRTHAQLVMANLSKSIIPIPIKLKGTEGPKVPQWPLSKEKIEALTEITERLLAEGKVSPAEPENPWNTPIFCIRKKSGKWRMLIDFRVLNKLTAVGREIQMGLPFPGGLSKRKYVTVLDVGDAYFTIPLDPKFRQYTAFTLLTVNNQGPARRFVWNCLPQGWNMSPYVYQRTMDEILRPWRKAHLDVDLYQYMDDIYIGSDRADHKQLVKDLRKMLLEDWSFETPEEKLQEGEEQHWLGYTLHPDKWTTGVAQLEYKERPTLHDLQKWVGLANWHMSLRKLPILGLLDMMKGPRELTSHRDWTEEGRKDFDRINEALQKEVWGEYFDPSLPLKVECNILKGYLYYEVRQPKGKEGIVLWRGQYQLATPLASNPAATVMRIFQKVKDEVIVRTGQHPIFVVPTDKNTWKELIMASNTLTWTPEVEFAPKSNEFLLTTLRLLEEPPEGFTYWTDGGRRGGQGKYGWIRSDGKQKVKEQEGSNQMLELQAIQSVLEDMQEEGIKRASVVTDSKYAYQLLRARNVITESPRLNRIWELWKNKEIFLAWVPGHKGIPQNEEVDRLVSIVVEGEGIQQKRETDAGFDLSIPSEIYILAGETRVINTHVRVELPEGWWGLIRERSSLAMQGVQVLGGVIDQGYRGELKIILHNHSRKAVALQGRIAQLILIPLYNAHMRPGQVNRDTERGEQGFGSTGVFFVDRIEEATTDHETWHGDMEYLMNTYNLPRVVAKQIIKECPLCTHAERGPAHRMSRQGAGIWQADVTIWRGYKILNMVETTSGLLHAEIIKEETARETAAVFLRWFRLFGDSWLHTDNGSNFIADLTENLLKLLQVRHTTGAPYHPQSQGIIERYNGVLKDTLEKVAENFQTPQGALEGALITLNQKRKGGIVGGYSPQELYFYRKNRELQDIYQEQHLNKNKKFAYVRFPKEREWTGPFRILWEGEGAKVIDGESKGMVLLPLSRIREVPSP